MKGEGVKLRFHQHSVTVAQTHLPRLLVLDDENARVSIKTLTEHPGNIQATVGIAANCHAGQQYAQIAHNDDIERQVLHAPEESATSIGHRTKTESEHRHTLHPRVKLRQEERDHGNDHHPQFPHRHATEPLQQIKTDHGRHNTSQGASMVVEGQSEKQGKERHQQQGAVGLGPSVRPKRQSHRFLPRQVVHHTALAHHIDGIGNDRKQSQPYFQHPREHFLPWLVRLHAHHGIRLRGKNPHMHISIHQPFECHQRKSNQPRGPSLFLTLVKGERAHDAKQYHQCH